MQVEGDLSYLQPLLRYTFYFGVCPVRGIRDDYSRVRPWYKYYGIFLMCFFTLGNAAVFTRVLYTIENDFPTSLIVIENISVLSLSAALVSYIYKFPVGRAEDFRKHLLELIHAHRFTADVSNRRVYAELIIGTLLIVFCIVCDMVYADYSGGNELLGYIGAAFWYVQEYYLYVVILVMRNYVLALEVKFKSINNYLEDCTYKINLCRKPNQEMVWSLGEIPRLYTTLCEQVVFYNHSFGLPMLCLTVYCLGEVLYAFTIIFVNYIMSGEDNGFVDAFFFHIYIYIWMAHVLVYLLLIVSACEASTKEMRRTCVLCYALLHELEDANKVLNCDDSLRDSLTLLAVQSGACTPIFSAAGLFAFDNSSLFTLFNIVLSYLLTVIQLS